MNLDSAARFRRPAIWSFRVLAAFGLLTILVMATPVVTWFMPRRAGSFDPPAGDTLVVLGAGEVADFPDLESYWRCVYAVRFFRTGSFHKIVLAGGPTVQGEEPVAAVMAAFLRSAGIPADKMMLETSSRSTRENALFVRELLNGLQPGKIVLLTSDYHTQRAQAVFRHVGMNVAVVAVPYILKLGNMPFYRPMLLEIELYEYAKRLWYRLNGWT